jgi:AcrR family transcriptional regulator
MSSKNNSTRTRILKSARSLLEDGEGSSVRMTDIARAAKISRQALYLHFPTRAELLVATTRYLDELHDIDSKLVASRSATSGRERLGNYIPEIYGIAKALLAMKDSDAEAKAAWNDRMQAVRHGCVAAVAALKRDDELTAELSEDEAADVLWTLLSVRTWEQLRMDCGWSQERYIEVIQATAARTLLARQPTAPILPD